MGAAAIPIALGVMSLVGTGMAFYGQQQQADAQARMAEYNYAIQKQQAELQANAAKYQSELAYRQAQMQSDAAMAQYQAQQNNAKSLENEALRVEREARERAKRMREENEQLLSAQVARFGSAGVTSEGSPLLIMSDSAVKLEQAVGYEMYAAEQQQRSFYRKAEMERFQSGFSLMDSAAAQYEQAAAKYQGQAAEIGRSIGLEQARYNYMGNMNEASNLRTGSYANLLTGIGNAAYMGYSTYRSPGTSAKPATGAIR